MVETDGTTSVDVSTVTAASPLPLTDPALHDPALLDQAVDQDRAAAVLLASLGTGPVTQLALRPSF